MVRREKSPWDKTVSAWIWGLLKDEIFDHGKVKEIELSGNRCRILLSDWTLEKTAEAMERIEISPLVDHVELTRQNEQTELEVLLAGGEDHDFKHMVFRRKPCWHWLFC